MAGVGTGHSHGDARAIVPSYLSQVLKAYSTNQAKAAAPHTTAYAIADAAAAPKPPKVPIPTIVIQPPVEEPVVLDSPASMYSEDGEEWVVVWPEEVAVVESPLEVVVVVSQIGRAHV